MDVRYNAGFLPLDRAEDYYARILAEADWHRPEMKIYGKPVATPRQVAWHADEGCTYKYSGQEHSRKEWTPTLDLVRSFVQFEVKENFNGVLLNYYVDGSEYVSPHADDESDLVPGSPIAVVSLGAERDLVFKINATGQRVVLPCAGGSMYVMAGDTQKVSKHSVPKRAKCKEPRISLTFRKMVPFQSRPT